MHGPLSLGAAESLDSPRADAGNARYRVQRPSAGVGESGRPRHPVTVDIIGSNPIVSAPGLAAY